MKKRDRMRLFQCRNRNQVGVLLALISAGGCGERPDDGQRAGGALIGGTNLLTGRPEVVSWSVGCTATMISSNVFVSAAHCINHAWQATGTAAGTITNTALGQGPIPVERVFSQGLADALSSTDPDDIAFGRLAAPMAGINPAAISTVEPTAGWLTAVGYGCTNRSSCNPARTYIQYFYDGSTPSNIADHGDSGGPTFIGQLNDNGP